MKNIEKKHRPHNSKIAKTVLPDLSLIHIFYFSAPISKSLIIISLLLRKCDRQSFCFPKFQKTKALCRLPLSPVINPRHTKYAVIPLLDQKQMMIVVVTMQQKTVVRQLPLSARKFPQIISPNFPALQTFLSTALLIVCLSPCTRTLLRGNLLFLSLIHILEIFD